MLESVKIALRIKNTAFDAEILDLIDAAKLDLGISGVININELDALIKRAITTYVKANFGWDNPEAERLQESYLMLKQHLALSGDYNVLA